MEVVMQHRKGTATPIAEVNPQLPAAAAELVESMMKVEPGERLQTMVDVRERIRKLLGNGN
jgi:hypothetical protein